MASTGLQDMNQLTPDNGAVLDLRELLFLTAMQSEALERTMTIVTGAVHGKKVGGIGEMGLVGTTQPNCKPDFNSTNIATQEKEWDLGQWTVAEEICYKDLLDTIIRMSLRKGTDIADMTGGEYIDLIVEPLLAKAIEKMLWRLYWFGDKTALNASAGGIITDGIDTDLFKVADGFFKRLLAITAADPSRRTVINANTETTYASQKSAIRDAGVAMDIFESLIYDADMRLRQASDKVILCTQSMADALAIDVKRITGSDLQWESMFDGLISATKWNGQEILALPRWDEMIASFENNGTVVNKPHRAVFASIGTLWAGVESTNLLAQLKIWFSEDLQANRMLAKDFIGTLIWEDYLVQYAY